MRADAKGMAAVLLAAVGYSTVPVIGKMALEMGVRVWPLLAWRFLLGATAVWLFVGFTRRPILPRERLGALIGLGVLYTGNSLAFMVGLQWVSAATASLVFFIYPAVVVLLARIFLGESLTTRRLVALLLAIAGCSLTVGTGLVGGEPIGIALILVAVAMVSLFILASGPVLHDLPEFSASAVILTVTAASCLLVSLFTGGLELGGEPRAALLVLLIGLLSTALPVTLFLVGIKYAGAARAAIFSAVEPALTVVLAALLLGERITTGQVAGGLLILSAVLWLRLERRLPESEEPMQLEAP